MFREVVDDIQKVVDDFGKKGKYDFILDSRNIMYGKEEFDLTDAVIKRLNK
jgi:outer membrane protein